MINKEIKQQIIDSAVAYFNDTKNTVRDEISYDFLEEIFSGVLYKNEIDTAGVLLACTALVHNIPRKNKTTGIWEQRLTKECYSGLITFVKANRLEKFVIFFSNSKPQVDLVSGRVLASLKFLNTNHNYLTAGLGKREPDLIDSEGKVTYEVKTNYRSKKSVSGFHGANMLIDCDGTHIIIYPILYDESVDFQNKFFHFRNVIPESLLNYSHAISEEILEVIKSGELISEVENVLAKNNFYWNP